MMTDFLGVAPQALTVPDIDTHFGLLHTLFALEDIYGLKISEKEGEVCLSLDHSITPLHSDVNTMLRTWQKQSAMLENGEISREESKQETFQYKMKQRKKITSKLINKDVFVQTKTLPIFSFQF